MNTWLLHVEKKNLLILQKVLIIDTVYLRCGIANSHSSQVAQTIKKKKKKNSACNVGDLSLIPGLGRSCGEGNGNPLQYSCLENPTDRGAWRATVHGVAKSRTWLSDKTIRYKGTRQTAGVPPDLAIWRLYLLEIALDCKPWILHGRFLRQNHCTVMF